MTRAEYQEMVSVLRALMAVLLRGCDPSAGVAAAELTYAVNVVANNAASGVSFEDIQTCFALAVQASATQASMTAVFAAAQAMAPVGAPAKRIAEFIATEAVIRLAVILNAATFASRDAVDAALAQVVAAFATVESLAAAGLRTTLYRALIAARGATVANLTSASYPLPQLVSYSVGRTMSALSLAQRIYGDASRAGELAAGNGVFNPAFMPLAGQALSA